MEPNNTYHRPKTESIFEVYVTPKDELSKAEYGEAHSVKHKITKETRTIKVVKKKLFDGLPKTDRAYDFLRALDHPHIATICEVYENDRNFYVIEELCEGGELLDFILDCGSFSESQAALLIKQILSGLSYLHSLGLVHGDIRPENLWLKTKDPLAPTIKITNFGSYQIFLLKKKSISKLGSICYSSPERLKGVCEDKADLWACGVILYTLLCGYQPFTTEEEDDTLVDIINGAKFEFHSEPSKKCPDWDEISAEAKDLIKLMLEKDPKKRISAKDALQHPWIQGKAPKKPLGKKLFENMKNFSAKNRVQQGILTYIVKNFVKHSDVADLEEAFKAIDKDGSGTISKAELLESFQNVEGVSKEEADVLVDKILKQVDLDGSGEIDYSEFLIGAMNYKKLVSDNLLKTTFKALDKNGDGTISKAEFGELFSGIELADDKWESILASYDKNNDGLSLWKLFPRTSDKKEILTKSDSCHGISRVMYSECLVCESFIYKNIENIHNHEE